MYVYFLEFGIVKILVRFKVKSIYMYVYMYICMYVCMYLILTWMNCDTNDVFRIASSFQSLVQLVCEEQIRHLGIGIRLP
jgi:hypothetical protein